EIEIAGRRINQRCRGTHNARARLKCARCGTQRFRRPDENSIWLGCENCLCCIKPCFERAEIFFSLQRLPPCGPGSAEPGDARQCARESKPCRYGKGDGKRRF